MRIIICLNGWNLMYDTPGSTGIASKFNVFRQAGTLDDGGYVRQLPDIVAMRSSLIRESERGEKHGNAT